MERILRRALALPRRPLVVLVGYHDWCAGALSDKARNDPRVITPEQRDGYLRAIREAGEKGHEWRWCRYWDEAKAFSNATAEEHRRWRMETPMTSPRVEGSYGRQPPADFSFDFPEFAEQLGA